MWGGGLRGVGLRGGRGGEGSEGKDLLRRARTHYILGKCRVICHQVICYMLYEVLQCAGGHIEYQLTSK